MLTALEIVFTAVISSVALDFAWYLLIFRITTGKWLWHRNNDMSGGGVVVTIDQYREKGHYLGGIRANITDMLGLADNAYLARENERLKNRIEQLEAEAKTLKKVEK